MTQNWIVLRLQVTIILKHETQANVGRLALYIIYFVGYEYKFQQRIQDYVSDPVVK